MTEGYNGHANWQTWNVNLWLGNDEGLYLAARAARVYTAADAESFVRELMPNGTPDMTDGGAGEYEGVDWDEVLETIEEFTS